MNSKPNIIYIFSDQHRADSTGFMAHPSVISPHLDTLAKKGVVFTNCFTNSPLCMPARASMMTGQPVCEHGVWDNHNEVNPSNAPSHVRNIKEAGFHTALIGKTHLYSRTSRKYSDLREQNDLLHKWGFEEIHETCGHMASHRKDSIYSDYLKDKGLLTQFRTFISEYSKHWSQGNDIPWEQKPSPLPAEDYLDSYIGKMAADWLDSYEQDKPFYLQVLFPGPHDPFDSPQKYRDLYDPSKIPPALMEYPKNPIPYYVNMVLKWSNLKNMTPEQNQLYRSFYYAKITLIDEMIGKIVEILEKKGLLENTWIIYSSDHGEMIGDHMLNHKMVFYEQAIRVPCLVCPPKNLKSTSCDLNIDLIDLSATMLDIAGAKALPNSSGRSVLPLISPVEQEKAESTFDRPIFSEVLGFTMIRTSEYKLVVATQKKIPVEFYDLKSDPLELTNQVNNPDYQGIQQELLKSYLKPYLKKFNRRKYIKYLWGSVKRYLFTKNYPKWVKETAKPTDYLSKS